MFSTPVRYAEEQTGASSVEVCRTLRSMSRVPSYCFDDPTRTVGVGVGSRFPAGGVRFGVGVAGVLVGVGVSGVLVSRVVVLSDAPSRGIRSCKLRYRLMESEVMRRDMSIVVLLGCHAPGPRSFLRQSRCNSRSGRRKCHSP